MQYRHSFHAGNFADVHKHIALLQLIEALQKKAKGFLYLETHAGEGLYDLGGAGRAPQRGKRCRHPAAGAATGRCAGAPASSGDQALPGRGETHSRRARRSLLSRVRRCLPPPQLRHADQAICVESQPQIARALQRAFERSAALLATIPRVITGDGYHEVRSQLPPPSRRGLTFIDPPYESADEEQQIAAALTAGLERFETGVFAVWYPIKKQYDSDLWLARVTRGIERPTLAAELCVSAPDHAAGLNGSGMLVVNPPWQFDSDAGAVAGRAARAARWQRGQHGKMAGA